MEVKVGSISIFDNRNNRDGRRRDTIIDIDRLSNTVFGDNRDNIFMINKNILTK